MESVSKLDLQESFSRHMFRDDDCSLVQLWLEMVTWNGKRTGTPYWENQSSEVNVFETVLKWFSYARQLDTTWNIQLLR